MIWLYGTLRLVTEIEQTVPENGFARKCETLRDGAVVVAIDLNRKRAKISQIYTRYQVLSQPLAEISHFTVRILSAEQPLSSENYR